MARRFVVAMAACAAFMVLLPPPAAAQYLDPGASSIIVQVIIAGVVGLAAILKLYWHRIKGMFGRKKADTGAGTKEQ